MADLPDDSGEIPCQAELPDDSGEIPCQAELPDDSGEIPRQEELPDDSGEAPRQREMQGDAKKDPLDATDQQTVEEKQEIANKAARDYNEKYDPCGRARQKGYDVKETPNGGVSFEGTDALYSDDKGTNPIVTIEATGDRSKDFDRANKAAGLEQTPEGYVWHHLDDYDVKTNSFTMQLVKDEAHNATKPHSGGCAQYNAVNGKCYK